MSRRAIWGAAAVVAALVLLVLVLDPFDGSPAGSGSSGACSARSSSPVHRPASTAARR
ncbi:MAG TPA: hypothetical protein VJ736_07245 [Actinomycetota bacterium]|nr:hypothetical protein [Actinomycetota bacterium]